MAAVALAVIGKNNVPLYIKTFLRDDIDDPPEEELFGLPTTTPSSQRGSLRQQFILHSALDRFEKISGPYPGCAWREQHPGIAGNDAMFVGLLCPVEDLRVYGYMTTTQVKFLLTVQDEGPLLGDQRTMDETLKHLFIKLHRQYVEYSLNPFSSLTGPIVSSRFDQKITEWVAAYNRVVSSSS